MNSNVQIDQSWYSHLKNEFEKEYFFKLKEFLIDEKKKYSVFPPGNQIFAAFNKTPFEQVKLVILGQDPYHNIGQAHGLCFSVPEEIPKPPSLINIFKELHSDLGVTIPEHGNLSTWTKQGVFLLNATLTVRAHQAGSHQNKGWETFTDKVISTLSEKRENLVFLLWGRYAQNKEKLIDTEKHLVLKAVHPSPLSAYNGFFGCKHFSLANLYLEKHNIEIIDWTVI